MSARAVAEVARHCTYEDADDPFVFAITRAVLAQLSSLDAPHLDLSGAAYVFKLLAHIGYRPDCSSCVACEDEAPTYFSAHAGGLLCASCASSVAGSEALELGEPAWLASLISMRFDELAATPINPYTAARLLGFSHVWAATHLDCRLRALEFLLGR